MNKILKKGLIMGGIGTVLGFFIGLIFVLAEKDTSEPYLFRMLVGALYGGLGMGTSAVYDIPTWSVARSTITHFVVTLLGFYVFAVVEEWMSLGDEMFCIMSAMFLFTYFMIWMFQYLAFYRQIRVMNDELRSYQSSISTHKGGQN